MPKFMLAIALAATAALGGCATAQIEQTTTTIEGDIQAAVSATCAIVPTVASIGSVVLAVTGQTSIAALSNAAIEAVEADLCSAAPATKSARYRALPLRSALPAVIGKTSHGVTVTGWRAQ